ncbi:GIY-YIG nuclease family protein [Candidatus Peribacteria bacterium]|nr:GIY-YIG nuclease family protein [Candidatus Peribacteria bacterium]
MFTVYVLSSTKKNYLYVGLTNNLDRRLNQHNNGRVQSTRPYRSFQLLYTETCTTRQEARNKEKYFKSGCGKEWLKLRDR